LVVANKMDLPDAAENLAEFRQAFPDLDIVEISALNHDHTAELIQRLRDILGSL